jgi:hypothetical protein
LCLIGTFSLPFFHAGTNVVYATAGMALICAAGSVILLANYNRLMKLHTVA